MKHILCYKLTSYIRFIIGVAPQWLGLGTIVFQSYKYLDSLIWIGVVRVVLGIHGIIPGFARRLYTIFPYDFFPFCFKLANL